MTPLFIDAHQPTEAERVLLARAGAKLGRLDVWSVLRLIRRAHVGADFSVAEAAFDEVVDRYRQIRADGLVVVVRPIRFGRWCVGSHAGCTYDVLLENLSPIEVSCSCMDFARSSLGICAHGLFVLEQSQTRGAPGSASAGTPSSHAPRLRWEPVARPRGEPDRLERLCLERADDLRLPGFVAGEPTRATLADLDSRDALLFALATAMDAGRLDATPAARTVVYEELLGAEERVAAKEAALRAVETLGSLRRPLHDYQRAAVLRFIETGAQLLADDMGLGKTTQAAASCHALLRSGEVRRILLVVPHSLKPTWAHEWQATTDEPLTIVDGTPERRADIYAETVRGVLVVGYEQLLRDVERLRAWAPEVVVLDEAQRIKNWRSKSAGVVKSLSPRYRLALTGTPVENRVEELVSILDFAEPLAVAPTWRAVPFFTYDDGDGAEGRKGLRNLDVLRARIGPFVLRRRRSDVAANLPPRRDHRIAVAMSVEQKMEHDALDRPIAALVQASNHRRLTPEEQQRLLNLLTRQRLIANGLAQAFLDDELWAVIAKSTPSEERIESLHSPKLAALRTLVSEVVGRDEKMVIVSQWRAMLRLAAWAIGDILAARGQRAVFFTGAESSKARERALVDLHDDPRVPVLFMTDAGGVGLNLQRAASTCVMLEVAWNPAVTEQRVARLHRPGQRRPVDVYHLVSEGGIETRISGIVARKRELFTALLDSDVHELELRSDAANLGSLYELPSAGPVDGKAGAAPSTPTPDFAAASMDAGTSTAPAEPGYVVTRRADGSLTIEVQPRMAEPVIDMLEAMADAVRAQVAAA